MDLKELEESLEGYVKAAQFIFDNFYNISYVGAGPISKVYKAYSE